jgi:hypothetical protein
MAWSFLRERQAGRAGHGQCLAVNAQALAV